MGPRAAIRLNSRTIFMAVAAAFLAGLMVLVVVRPALDRGGIGELVGVAAIFVAILLGERWLRTR